MPKPHCTRPYQTAGLSQYDPSSERGARLGSCEERRMSQASNVGRRKSRNIILRLLGPGLVTGAADDDPSGIATYSQAGAQFGYSLLWTVFLTMPFMIAIQLVSAQIGRVTGKGIIANVKDYAPRWLVISL